MKIATGHLQFPSLRKNTRVEAGNVNEHVKPNNETTHRLHFHFLAELLCGRRPRSGAPYSY